MSPYDAKPGKEKLVVRSVALRGSYRSEALGKYELFLLIACVTFEQRAYLPGSFIPKELTYTSLAEHPQI